MRRPTRVGSVAATMLAAALAAASAGERPAFVAAIDQATKLGAQKQWDKAADTYATFAATHASHPFAPLASYLEGSVLRTQLNQAAKARAAFARAAVGNTTLGPAFRVAARAWLARLQMEHLDAALRRYYVHKVEYPDKLTALVERKFATPKDLLDPWGKPFAYTTGRLLIAPKVPRQKYTLTCSTIKGNSRHLKRHLLKAYAAFRQRYQLRAIVPTTPPKAIVTQAGGSGKRLTVAQGAALGSGTMLAIAPGVAVLLDGEFVVALTLGGAKR